MLTMTARPEISEYVFTQRPIISAPNPEKVPPILVQLHDEEGDGSIQCPSCLLQIGELYAACFREMDLGRCPICQCDGIDRYEYVKQAKCEICPNWDECEDIKNSEEYYTQEKQDDLVRYLTYGS